MSIPKFFFSIGDGESGCECCCGDLGFPGFEKPEKLYKYLTIYDWDKCLFSEGISEGPYGWPVDGHVKVEAVGCDKCVVVESTGGYATMYPKDSKHDRSVFLDGLTGSIISDTKRNAGVSNEECENQTGDKLFGELSEPLNDDET